MQVGSRGSSYRKSAGKGKGADGCRGVGIKSNDERKCRVASKVG